MPQIALKFLVRLKAPNAEVALRTAAAPQIKAVLTGVPRHTEPRSAVGFTVFRTIELISDEFKFFMRCPFLFLAVDYNRAGLPGRCAGAPNHVSAPNHI